MAATLSDQQIKQAVQVFIKHVGATAQRELEKVVRNALASGRIKPTEDLAAAITLSSEKVGLDVTIHSRIEL
ncbi:MAG: hypothetical protein JO237_05295 [Pseudolabrys sp.]|nr:hypothetical protein [Pseudolabrys sp.]